MEGLKNNPIVKAIGTQRLVALIALIVIYISFGLLNNKFFSYATMVNIFDASYYIGVYGHRDYVCHCNRRN